MWQRHSCTGRDIRRWNLARSRRETSWTPQTPVYATAGERVVVDWCHVTDLYEVKEERCVKLPSCTYALSSSVYYGRFNHTWMRAHGGEWCTPWKIECCSSGRSAYETHCACGPVHGCPQPAAPHAHNNPTPVYLPCVTTRQLVHGLYRNLVGQWPTPHLWNILWNKQCSTLAIMKPKEDVHVWSQCSVLRPAV